METYLVQITPQGSYTELPSSQRIFGAICWAIKELYGENVLEGLLNDFWEDDNRFVISSSYPYGLLPCPSALLMSNTYVEGADRKLVKSLKKAKYMSLEVTRRYLRGDIKEDEIFQDIIHYKGTYCLKGNTLSMMGETLQEFKYTSILERRSSINRLSGGTSDGNLFYYKRTFSSNNAKGYFLIKTKNPDFFIPLFRYLSDVALGGDKSHGINHFIISLEGKVDFPSRITNKLLISQYIPNKGEVDWEQSFYKLNKGIFKSQDIAVHGNIQKNPVTYIEEGSLITLKEEKDIYGTMPIAQVVNGKNIKHNGIGFFL